MTHDPRQYKERTYRQRLHPSGLTGFRVVVQETDLFIHAATEMKDPARDAILRHRGHVEAHIRRHPDFATALTPWPEGAFLPEIVRKMVAAGRRAGVGPMAAVAGAVAEAVGRDLMTRTPEVIVENGGDIFIRVHRPATVGIFAGESPLSERVGLRLAPGTAPRGVCTSSGRIGHSLSFGAADAVCVVSDDCALADAAATAIGNRVDGEHRIDDALSFGQTIDGVSGIVVIVNDRIGVWGDLELVPLQK
jgi:uncharacterized protein